MRFLPLGTSDARLVQLDVRKDNRGSFARVWCADAFAQTGIDFVPVQANTSVTRGRGVVRGMHFQHAPMPDPKLVRCTEGCLHDVVVDLRPDAPTYGEAFAVELSAESGTMLYVPGGFAHGFQTLADEVRVEYLMGARYDPALYAGFRYDDPAVGILWPLPVFSLSPQDLAWPPLRLESAAVEDVS